MLLGEERKGCGSFDFFFVWIIFFFTSGSQHSPNNNLSQQHIATNQSVIGAKGQSQATGPSREKQEPKGKKSPSWDLGLQESFMAARCHTEILIFLLHFSF